MLIFVILIRRVSKKINGLATVGLVAGDATGRGSCLFVTLRAGSAPRGTVLRMPLLAFKSSVSSLVTR